MNEKRLKANCYCIGFRKLIVIGVGSLLLLGLLSSTDSNGKYPFSSSEVFFRDNTSPSNTNAPQKTSIRFHQNSFGGSENVAHYMGARSLLEQDEIEETTIPVSKVPRAIPSLFKENVINLWGNYVHDEHQSPFASFLYDRPDIELEKEQKDYISKMNKVRKEWGAWKFHDEKENRPVADLSSIPYKDFFYDKVDDDVWQKDEDYVTKFIEESKTYIERITEAVYAEYGYPTKSADGSTMSDEEILKRNKLFSVRIDDSTAQNGASWMTASAFEGFIRKLLHAIMTNDEFYVVLGGHSAAAGHGNNFFQDYIISFHYLMEPIFDRLGVRLISRDLAMGGLGTLHFSLGQGSLYGERDFLVWDSQMTEKDKGDKDLFNKQAILTGERVPIIFHNYIGNLMDESNGQVWHGDVLKMETVLQETENIGQAKTLPWATQYLKCSGQSKSLCSAQENKYHGSCWEPRTDVTPMTKQQSVPGGRASWHPGDRYHLFEGRKLVLTFLHGLTAAFEEWEQGIKVDGFPLKENYWHVGETYMKIQKDLEKNLNKKGNIGRSDCEKRFSKYPRVCRNGMSGMGEFTPRGTDESSSIRNYLKPAPNGYVPEGNRKSLYSGINLLPLITKLPDDAIDVHAIAIATSYKADDINTLFKGEKSKDDANGRQLLSKRLEEKLQNIKDPFSQQQFKRASNIIKLGDRILPDDDDSIVPGQGWIMSDASAGFCDGSSMSECNRFEDSQCLLYGHNDHRATLSGDALSGWLVVELPKLEKGLILSRIEWWHPGTLESTKGWKEVNNGKTMDDGEGRKLVDSTLKERQMKAKPVPLTDDFKLDIAIDGRIVKTMELDEYKEWTKEIAYNEAIFVLLDDENVYDTSDSGAELALRIRSNGGGRNTMSISHIYYA